MVIKSTDKIDCSTRGHNRANSGTSRNRCIYSTEMWFVSFFGLNGTEHFRACCYRKKKINFGMVTPSQSYSTSCQAEPHQLTDYFPEIPYPAMFYSLLIAPLQHIIHNMTWKYTILSFSSFCLQLIAFVKHISGSVSYIAIQDFEYLKCLKVINGNVCL